VHRGSKTLRENVPSDAKIASTVAALPGNVDLSAIADPHDLEGTHTAIFPARFGVCENGAVWVEEGDLGHRVLPVIAEHLFIVVKADQIVADMHAAYARVGKIGSGFGLFLAGHRRPPTSSNVSSSARMEPVGPRCSSGESDPGTLMMDSSLAPRSWSPA
jgi:hypothetical protein